jgi:type IV secretion system protein VirD4
MLDEFHSPLFFIGRLGLAMPVESTIDQRAILDAGLLKNNGVYVGAWRDKNNKIHYLRHAGPEHVLCYAPTRSGKGVGLVVPTLLSWRQSQLVTDCSGM